MKYGRILSRMWKIYSVLGAFSLVLMLITPVGFSLSLHRLGMPTGKIIETFWSYDLIIYFGLFLIFITAWKKLRVSLIIGIILVIPISYFFVRTFLIPHAQAATAMVSISAMLSLITEIICFSIIYLQYFSKRSQ
jgi:hypothetical protein